MARTMAMFAVAAVMAATAVQAQQLQITPADLQTAEQKIVSASRFFESAWRDAFASGGKFYVAPKLKAYTGLVATGCGLQKGARAFYCQPDHTVYYDTRFIATLMKMTANRLGSDGDYAPIVVLAHEMGHAVAATLEVQYSFTIFRENLADCLAGVVTTKARLAGVLDPGDYEEAMYALLIAGDDPGTFILAEGAHGDGPTRQRQFQKGYSQGIGACSDRMAASLQAPTQSATLGRSLQTPAQSAILGGGSAGNGRSPWILPPAVRR